jgi:hypothetical protein
MYRAGICKGVYPTELLRAWDRWSRKSGECENIRPGNERIHCYDYGSSYSLLIYVCIDYYNVHQLYAVLVLDYGGKDMEHFRLKSWCQAESLLRQVVWSLAIAERVSDIAIIAKMINIMLITCLF